MSKETTFTLKDFLAGGALPDSIEDLQNAVNFQRKNNEKAITGRVTLKHAEPSLLAGDTVLLRGLGPKFDGKYSVEKHSLILSRAEGLTSVLYVSRNATGDSSVGESVIGSLGISEDALEGSRTSDEHQDPEAADESTYSFEEFEEFMEESSG